MSGADYFDSVKWNLAVELIEGSDLILLDLAMVLLVVK